MPVASRRNISRMIKPGPGALIDPSSYHARGLLLSELFNYGIGDNLRDSTGNFLGLRVLTTWHQSYRGYSVGFNSNGERVVYAHDPRLSLVAPLAIRVIFEPPVGFTPGTFRRIVDKNNSYTVMFHNPIGSALNFYFNGGTQRVSYAPASWENRMYDCLCTWDGTTMAMHIDGKEVAAAGFSVAPTANASELWLASHVGSVAQQWLGRIALFQIWQGVYKDAVDAANLYLNPFSMYMPTPGRRLYAPFISAGGFVDRGMYYRKMIGAPHYV